VIRFDYLQDPPSHFRRAIRAARIPRRFHNAAAAVVGIVFLCSAAAAIEHNRVRAAENARGEAQARFERSRVALQHFRLQWREIDELVAQDRRLQEIRLSGTLVSGRVADLGNLFFAGVSVDSIRAAGAGFIIRGKAPTIEATGRLLNLILADSSLPRPNVVRVAKDSGIVSGFSFDISAGSL
jgi:hypothetical protein